MVYDQDEKTEKYIRHTFRTLNAPENFKQSLRQELFSMPNKPRRTWSRLYTAAALAAVFILTVALWSRGTQAPNPPDNPPPIQLPGLPPLTSTGPVTGGASPGPGFEVELTYQVGTQSPLPATADVYRYQAIPFSKEALASFAAKLSITGEVTEELWQDSKTYQIGEPQSGIMIIFPSGYYSYDRPLPDNLQGKPVPSQEELITAAQEFLRQIGIDPDTAQVTRIELPGEDAHYPLAHITFRPKNPGNQISISPFARIQVSPDKEVHNAGWVWPTQLESTQSYPLRNVHDAWKDIQNGRGIIAIQYDQVPGPETGTIVSGSGTIEENFIGYALTYDENYRIVMQPVAAFRGTATFDGGIRVPFTVYTSAVAQERDKS